VCSLLESHLARSAAQRNGEADKARRRAAERGDAADKVCAQPTDHGWAVTLLDHPGEELATPGFALRVLR